MATLAAELEARAHGAEFKRDPFVRPNVCIVCSADIL
jgi:hypothetical protein